MVKYFRDNGNKKQENNVQENDNLNNKQEENNGELKNENITDEEIEALLSYVPFLNGVPAGMIYDDAYDGNYNTIDTINKEILLYVALDNKPFDLSDTEDCIIIEKNEKICGQSGICYYEESETSCVEPNEKKINYYLNKAFRISNSELPTELQYYGCYVIKKDNHYFIFQNAGSPISYYKVIDSTSHKLDENNDLIIYENVYFYPRDFWNIYSNTRNMHEDVYKNNNYIYSFEISENEYYNITNDKIKQYLINIKPAQYKHIFKKDKDGYYWYSTEMIKDE